MKSIALIIGGTGGFGQACAHMLAAKDYHVVVAGRSEARGNECVQAIAAKGGEAEFITCDVTKRDDIRALHAKIASKHGRLDVAINSAGILGELAKTADVAEADMDQMFSINIVAFYMSMQEQIRIMLKNPGGPSGHVINFTSIYGLRGIAYGSPYSTSKHAVVGMTKSAAAEYAKEGIFINAIAPGVIPTAMIAGVQSQLTRPEADPYLANLDLIAAYPVGRFGTVDDIAKAVAYVIDNNWLVGSVLELDGGLGAV
ncbi:hypothetical protein LTR78_001124 [Recurvomyces mirabilis]|uniref:Uncharacterized protein n=1 Tax=Recurvomyces mirabilis TaxID=574656 RepID=A0AAE0WV14_9PEZI|nr:hypothetical protein LTR78_001124 [Recurvomyces mirabilis]KAK5161099.1 hypothetical protein LTS14_000895 [Recurvomyces mirabilis]